MLSDAESNVPTGFGCIRALQLKLPFLDRGDHHVNQKVRCDQQPLCGADNAPHSMVRCDLRWELPGSASQQHSSTQLRVFCGICLEPVAYGAGMLQTCSFWIKAVVDYALCTAGRQSRCLFCSQQCLRAFSQQLRLSFLWPLSTALQSWDGESGLYTRPGIQPTATRPTSKEDCRLADDQSIMQLSAQDQKACIRA